MLRTLALALLLSCSVFAQMPKGFYAWWAKPVVKNLNLSQSQKQQIHGTVQQFRAHLIDVRAEVAKAELDLEAQFNRDPVDQQKANEAIERLIAARTDLTRTLSQMSLKLRMVLNEQQWRELQRLRPMPGQDSQTPTELPGPR
jgi:Spy/CpxP family protein refolding chaperone